jgi:SAM-dependent methyltransferase
MHPPPYDATFYPECLFGGFTDIDGTVAFYTRVNALLRPEACVIDFGCGRGAHADDAVPFRRELTRLKGKAARVIGLDADPEAARNPRIDEFVLCSPDGVWPVPNRSTGLILCDQAMEHLPDPRLFFAEAGRVLEPGGYLCIRTTNVLSYSGIATRLLPNRYHAGILRRLQTSRESDDVFPTLFRCNTVRALRRGLSLGGFRSVVYGHEAEPAYLRFSKLAYGLGVLHRKFAPGLLRPTIFAFAQTSAASDQSRAR